MREEAGKPITEPNLRRSLLDILADLSPIDEDFPEIDDPVPDSLHARLDRSDS